MISALRRCLLMLIVIRSYVGFWIRMQCKNCSIRLINNIRLTSLDCFGMQNAGARRKRSPVWHRRYLSIENKINHDKFMICLEVLSIVSSLPESQQLLFEYIQGGMTQPQLKNALGVTPQAVDQRLKRLFRTITRELDIRLGFSEEYIRKIYFYKSEFHILRRMTDC